MGRFLDRLFDRFESDDSDDSGKPDDVAIAHASLADEDFVHAAFHLGWALFKTPERPELMSLITRLVRSTADPLSFVPQKPKMEAGAVALRAHLLARRGHLSAALLQIHMLLASEAPSLQFAAWAVDWLEEDDALTRIRSDDLHGLFSYYCMMAREKGREEARLDEVLPLARRAGAAFPEDTQVIFLVSTLLRYADEPAEALKLAGMIHERGATWQTAIGLALAHRACADVESALAAYRESTELDPEDTSAWLDIGDLLLEYGRDEEARPAFETALERRPTLIKALGALAYIRYRADGGEAGLTEVVELAEQDETGYVGVLARQAVTPYLGYLPDPAEATINGFRQMAEQYEEMPEKVTITVDGPEAPSLHVGLALEYEQLGKTLELEYRVTGRPSPDPMKPAGRLAFQVWNDDEIPRPVLPPPEPELLERVAEIAARPYIRDIWWRLGGELARELTAEPDQETKIVKGLLAVMTRPPVPRLGIRGWDWLRRVQFAAAFTLAQIGDAWRGSARRRAIKTLVDGPMDWTVEAALVAAGTLVRDLPEIRNNVLEIFMLRLRDAPKEGYVPYLWALCVPVLEMKDVPDFVEETFADLRDGLRQEHADD